MIEFAVQRLRPVIMIDALSDVAIEVAIRTFGEAEWPVEKEGG